MLAADYPFFDILWTMVIFFAWVIWFWLLITVFADLFRPDDAWMLVNFLGFNEEEAAELLANQKEEILPEEGGEPVTESPEEYEQRKSALLELIERCRTLKAMKDRRGRRALAMTQARERQDLAEQMMKLRSLPHRHDRSGYRIIR